MYDAGFFDADPSYTFTRVKTDRGTIAENVSARQVKTSTMTFSVNVDFDAVTK